MLYPISTPKPNSAEDFIGFIDTEGRIVVPPSFEAGAYFSEGKAAVVCADSKSGFIDSSGTTVIPPLFQGLGRFQDGLCSIGAVGVVGYIDHQGQITIPRIFEEQRVQGFGKGVAGVQIDGPWLCGQAGIRRRQIVLGRICARAEEMKMRPDQRRRVGGR